mgnify:FL=1
MCIKKIMFNSLDELNKKAWKTLDFAEYDKEVKKINYKLLQLSHDLINGKIDCVWYETGKQIISWTRSIKNKDTVQITYFLQLKNLVAMCDIQVKSENELFRESSFAYHGATLNVLCF